MYGNPEALKSLTHENYQPDPNSEFKLVTWKYHENPQYIGGTITGKLLSIETLSTDKNGNISYKIQNSSEKEKFSRIKKKEYNIF